jgi:Na+/H+-dicarboxylate symporter
MSIFSCINFTYLTHLHRISPLGICSLICVAVLQMDDPEVLFKNISYYMLTVLVGLFIHGFIILPAIYLIITRKNIFKFVKNMAEALLIALATSLR